MPTLRFRRFDEIPPDQQQHVAFLRARMCGRDDIDGIWGAQAHWLPYMDVAVSMSNGCEYLRVVSLRSLTLIELTHAHSRNEVQPPIPRIGLVAFAPTA